MDIRFETVMRYGALYDAYRKCRRNVAWKASVQKYIMQAPVLVYKTWSQLSEGKYKSPKFFEFDIYERGKHRHIRSTTIGERVVQRSLCDNALVPAIFPTLIYDCGACVKGKGYTFSIERMNAHLQKYIRKHGTDGYILCGDLKHFFDSIMHWAVLKVLHRNLGDLRLIGLTEDLIRMFDPNTPPERRQGLGLGSQISQILAPAVASSIDHFIKDTLQIQYYGRYMDDFYIIHEDKDYLHTVKEAIDEKCREIGLVLHPRKTQVVRLRRGFTWLKVHYHVTDTGKTVRTMDRRSITRERRKLKKLYEKVLEGKITTKQMRDSFESWSAHAARFASFRTRCEMERVFAPLYIGGMQHEMVQAA